MLRRRWKPITQLKNGRYTLLELPQRIDGSSLPTVEIVDMREELKHGRRKIVSAPLEELLQETLNKGEQAILLLNRRGHSTFVLCRECGYVIRCEHCNVSLVYHLQGGRLRLPLLRCLACGPCSLAHLAVVATYDISVPGPKKLEEELIQLFPGVRLARLDQDTTGPKGSPDRILEEFRTGQHDILLGTQMVAKGHDIENVTAVGILAADSTLNLPDFSRRRADLRFNYAGCRPGRTWIIGRTCYCADLSSNPLCRSSWSGSGLCNVLR